MGMRKRVAAAAAVVALVGIGGCSAGGGERGDDESMRATVPAVDTDDGATNQFAGKAEADAATVSAARNAGTSGAGGATASAAATAAPGDGGTVADTAAPAGAPLPQGIGAPKVIKTAVVEIEVAEGRFDLAYSKVPSIAAALGGFVASSTSSQAEDDDDARQAAGSAVLRVPADQFEAARTELLKLGELRSQQVKGEDVSAQLTDLDARLRNLRSQEEAIRLLMTKAKTIGETIEVQRQLGGVREQIEQLAAEQARLGDAVAMSTLTVNLHEPGAVAKTEPEPSPLGDAVARAFRGAQNVLAGVIVSLGYLVPLAVLLAAAWLVARPIRGRLSST